MSNNTGRTEVAAAQNQKEATINDADGRLDAALTEFLNNDYTSGDVTLTTTEFQSNVRFNETNLTVARDLNLPEVKKLFVVDNTAGTNTLTVTQGSTTIALLTTDIGLFYTDGTINGLVQIGGGGGASDWLSLTDTPSSFSGEAGKLVAVNGGENALEFVAGNPSGAAAVDVMYVRDEKTTGTNAGTNSAGLQIRTLNTVVTNTIPGASLSSNQITLPAGTYNIRATAQGFDVNRHRIQLFNVTDTSIALLGADSFISSTDGSETHAFLVGQITISATKTFELKQFTETVAFTGLGLGVAVSDGNTEVYAEVFIETVNSSLIKIPTEQTGTTYTTVLTDAHSLVRMNNAAANTVTIPPNSSVAYPIGSVIKVVQIGAGQTTMAPGAGVTISSAGALLSCRLQFSVITLTKILINTWILEGDLV